MDTAVLVIFAFFVGLISGLGAVVAIQKKTQNSGNKPYTDNSELNQFAENIKRVSASIADKLERTEADARATLNGISNFSSERLKSIAVTQTAKDETDIPPEENTVSAKPGQPEIGSAVNISDLQQKTTPQTPYRNTQYQQTQPTVQSTTPYQNTQYQQTQPTVPLRKSTQPLYPNTQNQQIQTTILQQSTPVQTPYQDTQYQQQQQNVQSNAPVQPTAEQKVQPAEKQNTGISQKQFKFAEVFELVEYLRDSKPDYRVYNSSTNRLEHSTDANSKYIARDNFEIFPNQNTPFPKKNISGNMYNCGIDWIESKNTLIPCIADDSGNIVKQGEIF